MKILVKLRNWLKRMKKPEEPVDKIHTLKERLIGTAGELKDDPDKLERMLNDIYRKHHGWL